MEEQSKDMNKSEAEFAGFVDRGTQIVLKEAIKQVVESFSQTEALEDMLGHLEEIRENLQNNEERIKELQQKSKQSNDRLVAMETSIRNLLQRIQTMEVHVNETAERIEGFETSIARLTEFFEKPPLSRLISKLEPPKVVVETSE
ncbi:MAG: hypothetical protein HUU50_08035 [Candidatus Brocadiae bacterium]|nr:hypothetical protein [Candidatus Brocadiia bacterium]